MQERKHEVAKIVFFAEMADNLPTVSTSINESVEFFLWYKYMRNTNNLDAIIYYDSISTHRTYYTV